MSSISKYHGVFPAFYACYDSTGNISPAAVKKFARFLMDQGVKGFYVGGSSGECIYQTVDERKLLLENVMEETNGEVTIIAHVACNSTKESMELARHAQSLKVDAIASIPPIYFRLPEAGIAKYWNDISSAAPDTDFIIYNIPQLAGVALTMSLLDEMLKNPRVIGVKNSSMPTQDIQMFRSAGTKGGRDFVVFNGPDEQIVAGLSIGAQGCIGGTYGVYAELPLKLYDLVVNEHNMEKARELQYDMNEIIYALCSTGASMYSVIKAILKKKDGIDIGEARAPFLNVTSADDAVIDKCIAMIEEADKKYL